MSKTSIAIKDEKGMVLVGVFEESQPVRWVDLDPETARQAAEAMAKAAYTARFGMAPPAGKSVIAEDKRKRLANRVAVVIRQLQERGRTPKYTAMQVVDIVLAGA